MLLDESKLLLCINQFLYEAKSLYAKRLRSVSHEFLMTN